MTLTESAIAVAETWARYSVAVDLIARNGMTEAGLRELVDAKNAHVAALELATLAALRVAHRPVLDRSLARAERRRT